MIFNSLRNFLAPLKQTPLHPQWLIFWHERAGLSEISTHLTGTILDIGAGHQPIRPYLTPDTTYLSLDYYDTAVHWYDAKPLIFGDGQQLPIASGTVDTVLLLDVLEHLPHPEQCIQEIWRVLQLGGKVIIQVPFLYPVHDAPLDFHRWTFYGLRRLADKFGFTVVAEKSLGTPVETAVLLTNLAFSQAVLQWAKAKNPLIILGILLPPTILLGNIAAWLMRFFSQVAGDGFMPQSYRVVWKKSG